MKYRLVIFDLDGTLADSFPWFLGIANSIADKHGFRRIEGHEIDALRAKTSRDIVKHLRVPAWKLPLIARDMRKLKAQTKIRLFPGVEEMALKLWSSDITLAVVSSDSENNVRRTLGTAARYFSHYECGASLFGKAEKFKRVLKRANIPAADTICIGDEVRDGEAAVAAGISFGAVTWGYAKAEALQKLSPAMTFARIEDVLQITG